MSCVRLDATPAEAAHHAGALPRSVSATSRGSRAGCWPHRPLRPAGHRRHPGSVSGVRPDAVTYEPACRRWGAAPSSLRSAAPHQPHSRDGERAAQVGDHGTARGARAVARTRRNPSKVASTRCPSSCIDRSAGSSLISTVRASRHSACSARRHTGLSVTSTSTNPARGNCRARSSCRSRGDSRSSSASRASQQVTITRPPGRTIRRHSRNASGSGSANWMESTMSTASTDAVLSPVAVSSPTRKSARSASPNSRARRWACSIATTEKSIPTTRQPLRRAISSPYPPRPHARSARVRSAHRSSADTTSSSPASPSRLVDCRSGGSPSTRRTSSSAIGDSARSAYQLSNSPALLATLRPSHISPRPDGCLPERSGQGQIGYESTGAGTQKAG
ncbi:hypothetical protein SAMN04489730_8361 [Amycolatopsis australiensis]|uniref:Uncharacterized protein n=1 Tax=Amycolatopsis australiensis TaxID=546364 RepID=A0A1K1T6R6_9PSEU|nr:hypothetical protein SAMN04489730_8361 [Amycolatopsis australiensis]